MSLVLEIISPDKKVFEGEVTSVKLPGSQGSFQVLKDHASLISALDKGEISFIPNNDQEKRVDVEGGVVEVLNNKIIVLVERVLDEAS